MGIEEVSVGKITLTSTSILTRINKGRSRLISYLRMFYTQEDLYNAVLPFGKADVSHFVERCNEWDIAPCEAKFYIEDYMNTEDATDMNTLFYALYCLRIQQLIKFGNELLENYTLSKILGKKLVRLMQYLENSGKDKIHSNYYCTKFDCDIINRLDSVYSPEAMLDTLNKFIN